MKYRHYGAVLGDEASGDIIKLSRLLIPEGKQIEIMAMRARPTGKAGPSARAHFFILTFLYFYIIIYIEN